MLLFTDPVTELTVNLSDKYTRGGIASVLQTKLLEQLEGVLMAKVGGGEGGGGTLPGTCLVPAVHHSFVLGRSA